MTDISALLQQGSANAWLFIPTAVFLGALHGLEPGHSKTMMAAFIVAVRGTVAQAVLLGLSAALSHTAIVWVIALAGLYFGSQWDAGNAEPYLQIASAVLIVGIALWMMWRISQTTTHDHIHDETHVIDTVLGVLELSIFEENAPPRFRLSGKSELVADQLQITTIRDDGSQQVFHFKQYEDYLESVEIIPEPHQFTAKLQIASTIEHYTVIFSENASHDHDATADTPEFQDAHELAHANDIKNRFANREITTGQIVLFGLTGGLIPCPASITVLLLCLQLKRFALGATLVLGFSLGLALTMVISGVAAALSVRHLSKKWAGFGSWSRKAPYFSSILMLLIAAYMGYQGFIHLA